jgi:4-hydroxy-3-methylbut-2-en-1-yl diphosphate synthase IspG/GcpE
MRNIKTEYVSCPSCGRTLFDLQEVTEQIRTRTGHLPGEHISQLCIRLHLTVTLTVQTLLERSVPWMWQP